MSGDPYSDKKGVLFNKLGITDQEQLDRFERRAFLDRQAEGVPSGNFDLDHLCAIHHQLFQDVYEWAGEVRTVEIAKGGSQFHPRHLIETGMADVHQRLEQQNYLRGLSVDEFADRAGLVMGDVNHVHPFREGNGRTQLLYLEQLGQQAGHSLDLRAIDRDKWIEASKSAHRGYTAPMAAEIKQAAELGAAQQRVDAQWQQTRASIEKREADPAACAREIAEARAKHDRHAELQRKATQERQAREAQSLSHESTRDRDGWER